MLDHGVYVITFTEQTPVVVWHSHDESEVKGYQEPTEHKTYYVASSVNIAKAHWDYWNQFIDKKRNRIFVSVEKLSYVKVILELQ